MFKRNTFFRRISRRIIDLITKKNYQKNKMLTLVTFTKHSLSDRLCRTEFFHPRYSLRKNECLKQKIERVTNCAQIEIT